MKSKPGKFLRLMGAILVLLASAPSPARAADPAIGSLPAGTLEVTADSFGLPLADDATARLYDRPSVRLREGDSLHFRVSTAAAGVYTISFDMAADGPSVNPPEGRLLVDGLPPSTEAQNVVFPLLFQNSRAEFPLDRYGNQALIRQDRRIRWGNVPMRDVDSSLAYPVQIPLSAGEHEFEFRLTREALVLGSIYLSPFAPYPDYILYLQDNPAPDSSGVSIDFEAEFPTYKNDTSVRPVNSRSLEVSPYDTHRLLLNTLGGESWKRSGTAVYYEFSVPADGMYYISLRALQNTRNNFTVFRRITVNGAVPFEQLNAVGFNYSSSWSNLTLGGDTPYRIFLHAGTNVLGIEATDWPYHDAIANVQQALTDINALSIQIRMLTGNQVDRYREWVISDYIPDVRERLTTIAGHLQADRDAVAAISRNDGSQEVLTYQMAIDNLLFLAEDPDKIPIHMNRLSEGTGSAAQLLGDLLPSLQAAPLALDRIYVHSPDTPVPETEVPFYSAFVEGLKRFVYSFQPDPYRSLEAEAGELEVWVNRPRPYVDLMQTMVDQSFTPATGIRVKFSIMPDEAKLVLANAAGIQPDVALGVSTNVPYELAIRSALYDLRSFPDFDSYIRVYTPGSLLSYIIDDSVYAIPETQDFWVTFYRRDILDSLGLPVPDTWEDVIGMLPELQRYGMNFNTPLSGGPGSKGYLMTAPYFFNYGAQLYSPDGFSTGLNSEEAILAMKFMTDSFSIYGMPLTTSSFYNSFRTGSLPIGVSNFTDYIKLLTAAPELNGLWDISLYPATVQPDGTRLRYTTGSAQACILFGNAERTEEAWEFMKWWMSTETQTEFQQQLILNYGLEYLWISANLEAFAASPIPREHIDVILEAWETLQEPVKLPGSYMEERQISNAWNSVVFEGVNPRVALDESAIIINREITRKMEEFGYLREGVIVRQFEIPTIETVQGWMEAAP